MTPYGAQVAIEFVLFGLCGVALVGLLHLFGNWVVAPLRFPEPLDETTGERVTRWRYFPPCGDVWTELDPAWTPGPVVRCPRCYEEFPLEDIGVKAVQVFVPRTGSAP